MEKIDLLEKLVDVQDMNIELMNDLISLKFDYELKIEKINNLQIEIKQKDEKIEALKEENAELKKQIEILQQSIISIETPEENK